MGRHKKLKRIMCNRKSQQDEIKNSSKSSLIRILLGIILTIGTAVSLIITLTPIGVFILAFSIGFLIKSLYRFLGLEEVMRKSDAMMNHLTSKEQDLLDGYYLD